MTVPALPTSTLTSAPAGGWPGVRCQATGEAVSVIRVPRARSALAASKVSLACSGFATAGGAIAEGGQHQGAVGNGLRRRQPHAGADRPVGRQSRPGPVVVVIRVHTVERIVVRPPAGVWRARILAMKGQSTLNGTCPTEFS